MIRFLKGLILLPLAIVVVLLAVANHDPVTLSFDPFSPEPAFSLALPLYVIVFAAVALGILVGGVASWFSQGRTRRNARVHRRERDRLQREVDQTRQASPTPGLGRTALPAPR